MNSPLMPCAAPPIRIIDRTPDAEMKAMRTTLSAPGLVLKGRLEAVVESLDRVEEKRGCRAN